MGYSTNFVGKFDLDKQLSLDDFRYLQKFSAKDHRNEDYIPKEYGAFYCQWTPTEDGKGLEWDGGEKFTGYVGWLQYLIEKFFRPKGYVLSGQVTYQGEEVGDCGVIRIIGGGQVMQSQYVPQDSAIEDIVRKGLETCKDDEYKAYFYLKEIAKKMGIEATHKENA